MKKKVEKPRLKFSNGKWGVWCNHFTDQVLVGKALEWVACMNGLGR